MSWFANFLEGLRPLVYLFSKKHLRERYIATCCTGRLSSWSGAFKVNCSVHATWRWGTLQACLRYVIERKLAIQATFNRHNFSNPGNARVKKGCQFAEEDKAALKLDITSRKVHSRMWWAYAAVMNEAHNFHSAVCKWAESCQCHGWLEPLPKSVWGEDRRRGGHVYSEDAEVIRQSRLDFGYKNGVNDGVRMGPCTLAGKRAVELASGEALQLFEHFGHQSYIQSLRFCGGRRA